MRLTCGGVGFVGASPFKTTATMKNIKVTDEMYKFLMNLSKELNTQNHRCTRMPYFFQVQTKEQISVPDGCGIEAWHYDDSIIETDEEINEVIIELKEWDKNSKVEMKMLSDYGDWEKEEVLEEAGWSKINYDYRDNLENCFFTSKACDEHIRANKHNLNSPVNYLSGSFRNPELENVMKFLCELSGGKIHT